jgi:uncharacterized phage-associated protein
MAGVHAVADYVLGKINMDEGDSITNLKLQKIVYYCQGWHLALYDRPLFSEPIEAWVHGPAIPVLYQRFKGYGYKAIDTSKIDTDPLAELDSEARELIDEVWDKYGPLSGSELRTLSHSEAPWRQAREGYADDESCTIQISHDSMRDYYRSKLNAA